MYFSLPYHVISNKSIGKLRNGRLLTFGGWGLGGGACSGHMEITEASGALWEEKTQFIIRSSQ